jgi:glycosyltransferase involved in cell wall biosynthesis
MTFASVVIPTWNYAHYLPRAIESVLNQTGQDCEVVVVDDGSADDTPAVVERFQRWTPRVIYQTFSESRGPGAARNYGVKLSSGQYILFLDADDALQPDAVNAATEAIRRDPALDFVWGGHIQLNADGTTEYGCPPPLFRERKKNVLRYLQTGPGLMNVGTLFISRKVFERICWPEQTRIWADVVFNSHLLAHFDGVSICSPLVTVYKHAGSLRSNVELVRRDRLKTVDLLFDPAILPAELLVYRSEYLGSVWISLIQFLINGLRATVGEAKQEYLNAVEYLVTRMDDPACLIPRANPKVGEACCRLFRHLYRGQHHEAAQAVYLRCIEVFPRQALQIRHVSRYIPLMIISVLHRVTAPFRS